MKKFKKILAATLLAAVSLSSSSCYVRFPKELRDRLNAESGLVLHDGPDSTVSYDIPGDISEFVISGGFSDVLVVQVPPDSASKLIVHSNAVYVSGGDTSSCVNLVEYNVDDDALGVKMTKNKAMGVSLVFHCHDLKEISKAGSGSMTIADSFTGDDLEINMAGSGNLMVENLFLEGKLDIGKAGSGDIHVSNMSAETLDYDASGSGDAFFKGFVRFAFFDQAGSGNVDARDLVASENVTAKCAGSCRITYNRRGETGTVK